MRQVTMVIINNKGIWLIFITLIILDFVKSYPDGTEGSSTKGGKNVQNNVTEGVNSTGVKEMLEEALNVALEITTILPVAKKVENDATRKIKTISLPDNELPQNTKKIPPNLASISTEDIIKLQRIEDYYKRMLTGELKGKLNPQEIERHRSILVKIFNQLTTQSKDNRLNNNIKELLSTLSDVTNIGTLYKTTSMGGTYGKDPKEEGSNRESTGLTSENAVFSQEKDQPDNKNIIMLHELQETLLKNRENFSNVTPVPSAEMSRVPSNPVSERNEPHLKRSEINFKSGLNSNSIKNSFDFLKKQLSSPQNFSEDQKLSHNSTLSKRYGQISDSYSDSSTYSLNQYQSQIQSGLVPGSTYVTYPQLQQGIIYQSSSNPQPLTKFNQHQRGTLKQGALHPLSPNLGTSRDTNPESPLAITDSVALQGDTTKSLLDILLQANRAGSLSEYNNQLENALEAFLNPQKQSDLLFVDNINLHGLAITPKPHIRVPVSSGVNGVVDGVDGISPEVLANLLIRMQLPSTDELRNISSQLTRFGSPVQDIRQAGDLAASIQALLMAITTAITDIIEAITMFCSENPLVCVILALALCALAVHIYKKHGKKKKYHHKDSGYGGHDHGGGYHRKTLQDYEEYRMLDTDTQLEVVSDVLGKIDVFENWLKSLRSDDGKLTDTKIK